VRRSFASFTLTEPCSSLVALQGAEAAWFPPAATNFESGLLRITSTIAGSTRGTGSPGRDHALASFRDRCLARAARG
jgi:hypothetical protein